MTSTWLALWLRTAEIAVGAPEVVGRRLQLMQPASVWTPAALFEMQQMVAEKMFAAAESGWAIYLAGMSMAGVAPWWAPAHQQRFADHAVRAVHRALAPVSRRVRANVRRLRRR